jgi:modulator of FtsH protease HflK
LRDLGSPAARFLKILDQYQKAPDVTRQRMYLETMERLLGGTDKVIVDGPNQGVVPYLPLRELGQPQSQRPAQPQGGNR